MTKLRWGVLGTADIARKAIIPGLRRSELNEVVAVASRNEEAARRFAAELGLPRAYGSYEQLLADGEIDAVYIPLPNHLHVEWSMRALDAGKHVLCEKPIGLDAAEARRLLEHARAKPGLKIMEAFMYRHHPQWQRARELVREGSVGKLRTVTSFFSYYKTDPDNIRNRSDIGGGGLLDIGCYCISSARFLFGEEPERVVGQVDRDPALGIDRLTSALLEFPSGTASFTCATQLAPHQRVEALGDDGRLEVALPFNAPPDRPMLLRLQRDGEPEELSIPAADQYGRQGDLFARAVFDDLPVPTPLEDALANMLVVDAIFESARTGEWVEVPRG